MLPSQTSTSNDLADVTVDADSAVLDFAGKQRPEFAIRFRHDDRGAASLDGQWGCWYRFADGGRDTHDRSGRFVLFCAFLRRAEAARHDVFARLLEEPVYCALCDSAIANCPVPAPATLALDFDAEAVEPPSQDLDDLRRDGQRTFHGRWSLRQASRVLAYLTEPRWSCTFPITSEDCRVSIKLETVANTLADDSLARVDSIPELQPKVSSRIEADKQPPGMLGNAEKLPSENRFFVGLLRVPMSIGLRGGSAEKLLLDHMLVRPLPPSNPVRLEFAALTGPTRSRSITTLSIQNLMRGQ